MQQVVLPRSRRAGSGAGSAPWPASPAGSARRRRSTAPAGPASSVTPVSALGRRPRCRRSSSPTRPAPARRPASDALRALERLVQLARRSPPAPSSGNCLPAHVQQRSPAAGAATACGTPPRQIVGHAGEAHLRPAVQALAVVARPAPAAACLSAMNRAIAACTGNSISFCRYSSPHLRPSSVSLHLAARSCPASSSGVELRCWNLQPRPVARATARPSPAPGTARPPLRSTSLRLASRPRRSGTRRGCPGRSSSARGRSSSARSGC